MSETACNKNTTDGCPKAISPFSSGEIAMFRSFIAAAAVTLVTASPAFAAAEANDDSFAYKGVSYAYTTETKGEEKIVRGTAYAGKVPFELHIRKKSVEGTFNNRPVAFTFNDVKKLGINVDANK
jgi:hypothetical protein